MRKRNYHTSINLLLEPDMYQRMKMISRLTRKSMSEFIREGINLRLARYDKENNSMREEKEHEHSDNQ